MASSRLPASADDRNPIRPRFTPSRGTPRPAGSLAARSTVPSPPTATIMSTGSRSRSTTRSPRARAGQGGRAPRAPAPAAPGARGAPFGGPGPPRGTLPPPAGGSWGGGRLDLGFENKSDTAPGGGARHEPVQHRHQRDEAEVGDD